MGRHFSPAMFGWGSLLVVTISPNRADWALAVHADSLWSVGASVREVPFQEPARERKRRGGTCAPSLFFAAKREGWKKEIRTLNAHASDSMGYTSIPCGSCDDYASLLTESDPQLISGSPARSGLFSDDRGIGILQLGPGGAAMRIPTFFHWEKLRVISAPVRSPRHGFSACGDLRLPLHGVASRVDVVVAGR